MEQSISVSVLDTLPQADEAKCDALLRGELASSRIKLVVLDDDPTGVQTVHDVSVYTDWSYESVLSGFREEGRLFFILTNSRSFTAERTRRVHTEIAEAAARAARETGKEYVLVSRGDSTLRGHYPLETETLSDVTEAELGVSIDGEILCPFFLEGGRYTLGNTHYVLSGEELVPAARTEFARDATFGYAHSDLREYIEEKTRGAVRAGEVVNITIDELRRCDIEAVTAKLCAARDYTRFVVNSASYADVKLFAAAVYRALAAGKRFIFRTAASLVRELGGVSVRPLLSHAELLPDTCKNGGAVVVGSHTGKTTRQLEELRKLPGAAFIEFNSDLVVDEEAFAAETLRVRREMERAIRAGLTAVAFTCRRELLIPGDTPEDALLRSVKISDAVQSLVGGLEVRPAFVVAKGGITSSDVGTKALGVKRATVMGQICPGVPVWRTGDESRFPGRPFVIFPGNVGTDATLREAVEKLLN